MLRFSKIRRKMAQEDGTATIEFAILAPLLFLMLVSIFELGMTMTRLTMLEHGLDVTMRDIRLGTGDDITHDGIRKDICDRATVLYECYDSLKVELIKIDTSDWAMPSTNADCIDRATDAPDPVYTFNQGLQNDIMFIRACFVVTPIFPTFGLGAMMDTDHTGRIHLVASSAFSQEPN